MERFDHCLNTGVSNVAPQALVWIVDVACLYKYTREGSIRLGVVIRFPLKSWFLFIARLSSGGMARSLLPLSYFDHIDTFLVRSKGWWGDEMVGSCAPNGSSVHLGTTPEVAAS